MIALFSSLLFLPMLRPYGTSFFFPDSFIYRRNILYGIYSVCYSCMFFYRGSIPTGYILFVILACFFTEVLFLWDLLGVLYLHDLFVIMFFTVGTKGW